MNTDLSVKARDALGRLKDALTVIAMANPSAYASVGKDVQPARKILESLRESRAVNSREASIALRSLRTALATAGSTVPDLVFEVANRVAPTRQILRDLMNSESQETFSSV